ncbi:MAG: hypothetical protein WC413_04555 [Candidatus Nanoarchaeia archaeon]
MDTKDKTIIGLVVLLVLAVLLASGILTTGKVTNAFSCSDTDVGSRFIQGTITGSVGGNSFELTDYCNADGTLKEYSCGINRWYYGDTDEEGQPALICPNGCENGACLQ